jgi:hypothetical protein
MNRNPITSTENAIQLNGQENGSEDRAREMAARYRCEFVDLRDYHLDAELFKTVPVELMFRYSFVPMEEIDGVLWIAIADPSKLMMIDEIGLLLNRRIKTKVATLVQINEILKKTEQSQRVLDEASEGFVRAPATKTSASNASPPRLMSAPSSAWWIPPSSPHCKSAPVTFTLKPKAIRWWSSTALMECCNRPCSPWPRNTTPPSSPA